MTAKRITVTKQSGEQIIIPATIIGRFAVHRTIASFKTHYAPNYGFSISHIDSGSSMYNEFAFVNHSDAVLVAKDMERLFPHIRVFTNKDGQIRVVITIELRILYEAIKKYCVRELELKALNVAKRTYERLAQ